MFESPYRWLIISLAVAALMMPVAGSHLPSNDLGTTQFSLGEGATETAEDVSTAGYALQFDSGEVTSAQTMKVINNRSDPVDVEVTIALKQGSTTVTSGSKTFRIGAKSANSVTIIFENTPVSDFDRVEVTTVVV